MDRLRLVLVTLLGCVAGMVALILVGTAWALKDY